ncbi:hypothetical protein GOV07_05130 [Candidatus Woesearchaeota archaeon]|nr:hypothetical protein [Candidatus Woesearchaeota archaeon]
MTDNIEFTLRKYGKRFGTWLREKLFGAPYDEAMIDPEVLEDICVLAKSAAPKEMIAFLTGDIRREKHGKKTHRVLIINGLYIKGYYANHNSTSFSLHDLPLLDVYGTVHSHPGHSNRPSRADKQLFSRYGWFHMIICAPYQTKDIAVFNKYGEKVGDATGAASRSSHSSHSSYA